MSNFVIGIAGPARCGKNTAASIILSKLSWMLGKDLSIMALADKLKSTVNDLFDWDERHSDGYLKEVNTIVLQPLDEQLYATFTHHLMHLLSPKEVWEAVKLFNQFVIQPNIFGENFIKISPRYAYQYFGTEVVRSIRPNLWVNHLDDIMWSGTNLIVPDVRFNNEAEWVRENGILIHINTNRDTIQTTHASEGGLEPLEGEIVINNTSTLKQFKNSVEDATGDIYAKLNS